MPSQVEFYFIFFIKQFVSCIQPVKSALAVMKRILFLVFSQHFGSHRLKHAALQQRLAHTHHFVPRHDGTLNLIK